MNTVQRVQNISLLPILPRLVCNQSPVFFLFLLLLLLTAHPLHPAPARGAVIWCLLWSRSLEVYLVFYFLVQWSILIFFMEEHLLNKQNSPDKLIHL